MRSKKIENKKSKKGARSSGQTFLHTNAKIVADLKTPKSYRQVYSPLLESLKLIGMIKNRNAWLYTRLLNEPIFPLLSPTRLNS